MSLIVNTMIPREAVLLGVPAIRRLLSLGSGDAALMYLHLMAGGGQDNLGWSPLRADKAVAELTGCGLVCAEPIEGMASQPVNHAASDRRVLVEVPMATQRDIVHDLHNKPDFPAALESIEECIGKRLSVSELQRAHQLYDNLNQSVELLKVMLKWCSEEQARKYGDGHRPNMSVLTKEACIWSKKGIDTPDAARAYTANQAELYGRERDILRLLDIKPRNLIEQEREYIASWLQMGFDDQTIRLAYEKTIMRIQRLDWRYMDRILKDWHQHGQHSVEAVKAGRRETASMRMSRQRSQDPEAKVKEDMDRMRRLLAQMKAEDSADGG